MKTLHGADTSEQGIDGAKFMNIGTPQIIWVALVTIGAVLLAVWFAKKRK